MATEACGFTTIVIGTFLLHATRELDVSLGELSAFLAVHRSRPCVTASSVLLALTGKQHRQLSGSAWCILRRLHVERISCSSSGHLRLSGSLHPQVFDVGDCAGDLTALLRAPASASGQGVARLSSMELGRR